MTAAAVAQRLGLSEAAVAAFSGTGAEFAQFFGKSLKEGEAAVADLAPPPLLAPTNLVATVASVTEVSIAYTRTGTADDESINVEATPALPGMAWDDQDLTSPLVVSGTFAQGVAYTFKIRVFAQSGTDSPFSAPSNPVTPNP